MKRILGLDLGTNSIGWALVSEAETVNEKSAIVKLGVRVNPLTVDEQKNFETGKSIPTNAGRTLKRSMRRNLQRYKLRRDYLIKKLKEYGWITSDTILYECGNRTTFETYRLRAKAVTEKISLEEFGRVLLMINKKRGYKSSRKAKSSDEGQLIDGMAIAMDMYHNGTTPGEYVYSLLSKGKKYIPVFYRSDLLDEFDRIWDYQCAYYPDILTSQFKELVRGKSSQMTSKLFKQQYNLFTADNKEKDKRLQAYRRRADALEKCLPVEEVAAALCDVNRDVNASSGYLGAISDRSKELFFNKQTVGQYLISELDKDSHFSVKNKVFYRQDYLNEFEAIWEKQAQYHPELTLDRKKILRDVIIFYQRPLKSQKGLVACCELEKRQIEVVKDGKARMVEIGPKVCPKSSPLFQEFKIWQVLNNLKVCDKATGDERFLELDEKEILFSELAIKSKLSKTEALKLLYQKPKGLDLNYDSIEGNTTQAALFEAYQTVIAMTGHGEYVFPKMSSSEVMGIVEGVFGGLGFNTSVLHFDSLLQGKNLEKQDSYRLWHLLYSYEGDNSVTGTDGLVAKVASLLRCDEEYAKVVAGVTFQPDYGSLSAKAIRRILPHMRAGNEYSLACEYAGYKHSRRSLTKEELEQKDYKDHLGLLPRNSLRNPVVEKILNQMINVVNAVVDEYGKPDEIRIEMARELKKSAREREEMTAAINKANSEHERIKEILRKEFGIQHVSRNDIVRYKLYCELKNNGYKTLYSDTYIPQEKLFSKEVDIEHILPQARLFDDSFSNKTLEYRSVNIEKSNQTAWDYVAAKWGEEGSLRYKKRVDDLLAAGVIGKSKHDKLLMKQEDIPTDFINRDLRDTQYIARKAREILEDLVPMVVSTTGAVTDRLREDWQLVDVMQELNWDKYAMKGLTEEWTDKDGRRIRRIKEWTKRNDHRHHAMDALTIAFTKHSFIQYLNNLNARGDKSGDIYAIEQKELYRDSHGKLCFVMPFEGFRSEAKRQLENILVSIKAKNKVVTRNVNKAKKGNGQQAKVQLTPRGQLHNETIYGSIRRYVTKLEKVGGNFDGEQIAKVANLRYREALQSRLDAFGGDAKKAFTGKNALDKNPLYLKDSRTEVPLKVKTVSTETLYTIRKAVAPDLNVDKVIDAKVRKVLEERLQEYGGDPKKAFVNLDENPIYLNKAKGITIKRVAITGVNNAIALHDKKDVGGHIMLDASGRKQPVDFVNTGNNHHVAIYRDAEGILQEVVVSFYEAVARVSLGLPIIDREYHKEDGWQFLFTMKQNEYFVFPNPETGFDPQEVDLTDETNYALISPNLFRVQKLASKYYVFRHHLETTVEDVASLRDITWKRIQATNYLNNIIKVRVNHIGRIVSVGEY